MRDRLDSGSVTRKRLALHCFAITLTFLNFLAFLISRNNAWVNNPGRTWLYASNTAFRNYPASEFERTLSCYGLGQCQRIGGALIIQPLIFLTDNLAKFYFWQFDDAERVFIIQMVTFMWRIVCISFLCYLVFKVVKNFLTTLFFINSLFLSLSGWFLYSLGQLALNSPFDLSEELRKRVILAFQDFPFENLQWYDFGLFAALAIIPLLIRNGRNRQSLFRIFCLSLLLTSLFEYLGFVFGVGLILYERRIIDTPRNISKHLLQFIVAVAGSLTWLSFIALYHRGTMTMFPKFFDPAVNPYSAANKNSPIEHIKLVFWALQNPIENLTNNPSIPFQILLIAIQVSVLALIFGNVLRRIFRPTIDLQLLEALRMTLLGTLFVMMFNFFFAYGIQIQAAEHGRQTFGLQIVLFTYVFLRSLMPKNTARLEG